MQTPLGGVNPLAQVDIPLMGKMNKIVATGCHILRLKCTKFNPPAGGAYSAPSDPLAEFKRAYF